MLPRNQPDRIRIVFDDHRLVANAGLRQMVAVPGRHEVAYQSHLLLALRLVSVG